MSSPNGSTTQQVVPTDFTRQELRQVFKPWLEWSEEAEILALHELVVNELHDRGIDEIEVELGREE